MAYTNFTTNTSTTGVCPTHSLKVVAAGTWGSGTLTLNLYNDTLAGYVVIEAWTADVAKSIAMGSGAKYQLVFSGGTGQDVDVVHEGIYDG